MWISCLVAQAVVLVDAHLSISHPIIINVIDRRSSLLTSSLTSIRGGSSSESASRSSWTAGSKYNYGAGSKSYDYGSTTAGTSSSLQTPSSYNTNSKDTTNVNDETKEKFAEAFLQRDDRNRFIGKLYAR